MLLRLLFKQQNICEKGVYYKYYFLILTEKLLISYLKNHPYIYSKAIKSDTWLTKIAKFHVTLKKNQENNVPL